MDLLSILRTLGGLGTVLGLLVGALWVVRRYDIRLPGRTGMTRVSRLELIEKLPIDARRSVALLRRDGREHLILIAPEGHLILESAIAREAEATRDAIPGATPAAPLPTNPQFRAEVAAAADSFGALVDRVRNRAGPTSRALRALIGHAAKIARPTPPRPLSPPTRIAGTPWLDTPPMLTDVFAAATTFGAQVSRALKAPMTWEALTTAPAAPSLRPTPPISPALHVPLVTAVFLIQCLEATNLPRVARPVSATDLSAIAN